MWFESIVVLQQTTETRYKKYIVIVFIKCKRVIIS